jgi:GntR family transcriptional regulator / MocR family aminotransferase
LILCASTRQGQLSSSHDLPLSALDQPLLTKMVGSIKHLEEGAHSHYDVVMKRVPSTITPVIGVNRKSPTPLHRQIYDSFRDLIVHGNLASGQQIPSTRTLAKELGISRFPVLNAYAQLLSEGYFEGRIGSGTVVSSSLPDQPVLPGLSAGRSISILSGPRESSSVAARLPGVKSEPWLHGRAPFVGSQLALDHFPFNLWSQLLAFRCRNIAEVSLHYGHPLGLRDLREAIVTYLRTARAVHCHAEQIMIVSGSQQALDITARVLLDPKDKVWLEEPGYILARHIFMMAGSRVVPVPVDQEGLDVAAGRKRCAEAKAVYVCPSHQYPLGVVMSASRRLQLLNWAQSTGAWIIEDDYDSEFRYEGAPIASLQGLDRYSRVIYVGTFSKVLFPSVRVGYVVIPPDLVDRFVAVRQAMDIFPSNLHQQVLSDFINQGHFERHIRRMRSIYQERRNALVESLHKDLAGTLKVLTGSAGLHLTVMLQEQGSDVAISTRAARQNLWLWPLSICYMGPIPRQGFILGFGGIPVDEMPKAVRRLRAALREK